MNLHREIKLLPTRLLDLIAPRLCVVCHQRLSINERCICMGCNLSLPRTFIQDDLRDNEMAQMFWGRIENVEKCCAIMDFNHGEQSIQIVYDMKYGNNPALAVNVGQWMAQEMLPYGLFTHVDAIVPIPLSKTREKKRGYNQSGLMAEGMHQITKVPVYTDIAIRKDFKKSQTKENRWGRNENVEDVFQLTKPEKVSGKHLLIVDDVVTTGATIVSFANEIAKAGNVHFSVCSFAYVSRQR